MLELGSSGSVRGVSSNGHPYCDPGPKAAARAVPWRRTLLPISDPRPIARHGTGIRHFTIALLVLSLNPLPARPARRGGLLTT